MTAESPSNFSKPRVFVSYVREDQYNVDRLARELQAYQIDVWLDKNQLLPGTRWRDAIREAISEGDFFIACFSDAYATRSKSYMNDELTIAVEELRQRPTERTWFIPVLLSDCPVPPRSIGAGETLRDIQWVELYRNWEEGIARIAATIDPDASPPPASPLTKNSSYVDLLHPSLAPITALGALAAAILGLVTNWDNLSAHYRSDPILVGTAAAVTSAPVIWALIGYLSARWFPSATLIVRLLSLIAIGALYTALVIYPNFCLLTYTCGDGESSFSPFRINSLVSTAYTHEQKPMEVISVINDSSRSTFLLKRDDLSIHAVREDVTRISIEFDRQMIGVFKSATCRGIRGEAPIEDALPVWRSLLKDRGRNDLARISHTNFA